MDCVLLLNDIGEFKDKQDAFVGALPVHQRWREAEHAPTHWFSFFFATIRRACSELEKRLRE